MGNFKYCLLVVAFGIHEPFCCLMVLVSLFLNWQLSHAGLGHTEACSQGQAAASVEVMRGNCLTALPLRPPILSLSWEVVRLQMSHRPLKAHGGLALAQCETQTCLKRGLKVVTGNVRILHFVTLIYSLVLMLME